MAKIPVYNQWQTRQQPVPANSRLNPASPQAAGSLAGRGTAELGQAMGEFQRMYFDYNMQRHERKIAADILAERVQLEDEFRQFDSAYMSTQKEDKAWSAPEEYDKFFEDRYSSIMGRWEGNARAQEAVKRMVANMRSGALDRATAYRDQEQVRYSENIKKLDFDQTLAAASDPTVPIDQALQRLEEYKINTRILDGQKSVVGPDGGREWVNRLGIPVDIADMATATAREIGVPPELVVAVISTESGGKQSAVSPVGARGLMQLMPDTAKDLGVNPDDAADNIKGGVKYLKQLMDRYNGNQQLALMAYNWGMGNVDSYVKYGHGIKTEKNPTGAVPAETKKYVPKVMAKMKNAGSTRTTLELRKADQAVYMEIIEKAIVNGDYDGALSFWEAHSSSFGAQSNDVKQMIDGSIEAKKRKDEAEFEKAEKRRVEEQFFAGYNYARSQTADMPLELQDGAMAEFGQKIKDPKVREKYIKTWKQDYPELIKGRAVQDWKILNDLDRQAAEKNLMPSQYAKLLETQDVGLSEKAKADKIAELYGEGRKKNYQNVSSAYKMKIAIAAGTVDENDILATAQCDKWTPEQTDDVLKTYRGQDEGEGLQVPQASRVWKLAMPKIETPMPSDLFDLLAEKFKGQKPTDQDVLRAVSAYMYEGTAGSFWSKTGSASMKYYEAAEAGLIDIWTPDISSAEKKRIKAALEASGVKNITSEKIYEYWRKERGLP